MHFENYRSKLDWYAIWDKRFNFTPLPHFPVCTKVGPPRTCYPHFPPCGQILPRHTVFCLGIMFEAKFISFEPRVGAFNLAGAAIVVDDAEFEGVKLAARSLSEDLEKVTGRKSKILHDISSIPVEKVIVLGSLERSQYIQKLVTKGKLCVGEIEGKWESFTTSVVETPGEGVKAALVLAGSDKRGSIFAAYTLSEQIGVSP